ncbi:MAG: DUF72 domain-containing protein [Phycisphaerae bacterium]
MARKRGQFFVGTSGWQYDHWAGRFYPDDIRKKDWFDYYAGRFDTVEINNTFYNLPKAETFDKWREQTPEGFTYVLKYSRYGSHLKRLKDPSQHVGVFLDRAERLGAFLGPILVQLPGNFKADRDRLAGFLDAAPSEHRWALEFRDESWLNDGIYDVLREHNAALAIHDMIEDHPREITADWVYLRFHGDHYAGSYSPQALSAWAKRIRRWLEDGLDVYAFFNNDAEAHAPANALDLRRYVEKS